MAIQEYLAIVVCRVILALAYLDTVAFPVIQALDCPVIQELAGTPVAALADTAENQVCQAIVARQVTAELANLVIAESQVFQDTAVLEFQDSAASVVTLDRELADFLVKAAIPAFLVTVDQALADLVETQVIAGYLVIQVPAFPVIAAILDRALAAFQESAVTLEYLVIAGRALAATVANPAIAAFQVIQDRGFLDIQGIADIPAAESQATAEVAFQVLADIRGDPATAGCRARLALAAHRVTGDRSGLQQTKPQRQTPQLQ